MCHYFKLWPLPSPLQYNRAIIWRKSVITTTEGTIMKLCFWSLGWSSFSWLPFFIDFFYVNEVRQWNFLVNYNKCAIFHWFCARIGVCHISFKVCHFSLIFGHFILILCHHLIGDFLLPLATWISKIDYNKHRLGNPQKWNCQLFSLLGKKYVKLEVFLHLPVLSNIQAMRTYALRRSKIRVKHSLLNIAIYLEWVLPMQSLSIQRSRKTRLGLWDPICLLRPFLLYHFSNPFLCICLYLIYQ